MQNARPSRPFIAFVQFVGKKVEVLSAWKALQSVAIVTGDEVLGQVRRRRCAWNFRASERRAELVRAMPSAAENVKK